jgi:membrane fusion protein (multidrug efflux system)
MINTAVLYGISGLLFLTLAACNPLANDNEKSGDSQDTPPPASPPAMVSSVKVKAQNIPVHYEFVGQVAGSLEVDVRSRVTGIVEHRHFREGGDVVAGELLFTLDAAPFEAKYKQAEAAIESARAQKLTAEAQLKQAERELKRVTPLASRQMLSQNQKDDAASAVDIAVAQLAVANAAIKQAQANLLTSRIDLDYTRIRAPVEGIVGRSLQNRGALVQTGINDLLTTMVQIDPVHVNFGIPENDLVELRKAFSSGAMLLVNDQFVVNLVDEQDRSTGHTGLLDFQDYKVDNRTGNFAMRATVPNTERQLSPGQFVRVQLNGATKVNAIAIPQRAVLDGPGGKYVYVVSAAEQGGHVAMQKSIVPGEWVELDAQRQNHWIIKSGLSEGDEVIVDGVARIFFPGMPVQASPHEVTDSTSAN